MTIPMLHTKDITDVKFSPDGKQLVTTSKDQTIKVWRVEVGRLLYTLNNQDEATKVEFRQNGKYLVLNFQHH